MQIQLALLLSLENALKNGQFQTTIEVLRQRCVDLKSYEASNFMNNLNNNAKFFKTINKEQPLVLSPDGKSELADVIESMNGSNG